jgi:hypothetical protein
MLSCKQVATIASDYLDKSTPLKWQIRLHLLMCANCRRFVRHLKITQQVGAKIIIKETTEDAEAVWKNLQARLKTEAQSNKE